MTLTATEASTAATDAPVVTLKSRAIGAATWTVVGYGSQQVLRFGSNLVLTRLLAVDAFGLMALVNIFVMGLELLSDVGVGPAVIQSKRGDDRALLDTAWTVQIIRGFILFGLALILAWPLARQYSEPRLAPMLIVAGLGIIIRGFTPTRVHSLNRQIALGRVTIMELVSQGVTIVVMIAAAWRTHSAWALLVGALIGDVVRVFLSYVMLPGHRHRLLLERESIQEIVHIGRWVLLSTAVTFGAGQLDRLTLGRLLSVSELGVYSIAYMMVTSVVNLGRTVGSRVLFPVLAETIRERSEKLYPRLRRGRALWVLPTVAALLVLTLGGDWIVKLIYPAKFHDAGWMLQILAAGSIAAVLNQATGVVWPSLGEFRMITVLMIVQIAVLFVCMLTGRHLYGVVGFVVGVALVELVLYPLQSWLVARRKLWQPELDLPVLAVSAVVIVLGALARR